MVLVVHLLFEIPHILDLLKHILILLVLFVPFQLLRLVLVLVPLMLSLHALLANFLLQLFSGGVLWLLRAIAFQVEQRRHLFSLEDVVLLDGALCVGDGAVLETHFSLGQQRGHHSGALVLQAHRLQLGFGLLPFLALEIGFVAKAFL